MQGTADALRDAAALLTADKQFVHEVQTLQAQSRRYRELSTRMHAAMQSAADRNELLDTLIVGGSTLASYLPLDHPPEVVQRAYELAYPAVSPAHSLAEHVQQLDSERLVGLASGLKGKPKASDSLTYVQKALEHHPQIGVVTTSEVHGHLVMHGLLDHVLDSGITESSLAGVVGGAIEGASVSMDLVPSAVSMALIAFSAYSQEGLTRYRKCQSFGQRSARYYLAYLAGGGLAVATQAWWLAVLGSMGSRLVLGSGRRKRERLEQLQHLVDTNWRVLERLESCTA